MPHAGGEAFEVDLGGSSRRTSRPPPRLSSGTSSNTYSRAGTPATARDPNPRNTRFAGRANPQSGSSGIERKRIGEYGSPPLNSSSTSISSFKIGQQVKVKKANHKPGFEDGIILRKNTDGTYDVEYTLIGIVFSIILVHLGFLFLSKLLKSKFTQGQLTLVKNFFEYSLLAWIIYYLFI